MSKIMLVYGSTTGNTEWVANEIVSMINKTEHEVELKNVANVKAKGLCAGYDCVIFGCSTWGQDEIELQEDFEEVFEDFDKIEASGIKTAIFGCGDDSYEYYCGAVDAITEKLTSLNSQVIGEKLKINNDPADSLAKIQDWTDNILKEL